MGMYYLKCYFNSFMTKAEASRKRGREEDAEEGPSTKKQGVISLSSMAYKDVTSLRKRERR